MSQNQLPPLSILCRPDYACLVRLRSLTQKGGTIIAEEVTDRATHERCLSDPTHGYRQWFFCSRCGGRRPHVHDYRDRVLRAEPGKPVITTLRLECVACEAIWQILPLFVARHLWRTWKVVRRTLLPDSSASGAGPKVPPRTVRRWRQRWLRPALALAQVLATSGPAWVALAMRLRVAATCANLMAEFAAGHSGEPLASFAALIYRLQPKFRLL